MNGGPGKREGMSRAPRGELGPMQRHAPPCECERAPLLCPCPHANAGPWCRWRAWETRHCSTGRRSTSGTGSGRRHSRRAKFRSLVGALASCARTHARTFTCGPAAKPTAPRLCVPRHAPPLRCAADSDAGEAMDAESWDGGRRRRLRVQGPLVLPAGCRITLQGGCGAAHGHRPGALAIINPGNFDDQDVNVVWRYRPHSLVVDGPATARDVLTALMKQVGRG
jgi:hypothetical protein